MAEREKKRLAKFEEEGSSEDSDSDADGTGVTMKFCGQPALNVSSSGTFRMGACLLVR